MHSLRFYYCSNALVILHVISFLDCSNTNGVIEYWFDGLHYDLNNDFVNVELYIMTNYGLPFEHHLRKNITTMCCLVVLLCRCTICKECWMSI